MGWMTDEQRARYEREEAERQERVNRRDQAIEFALSHGSVQELDLVEHHGEEACCPHCSRCNAMLNMRWVFVDKDKRTKLVDDDAPGARLRALYVCRDCNFVTFKKGDQR